MRIFLNMPQKFKAALLLMIIVLTVIANSFWGNSTVTELNNGFSSIYKDRLIPANEMFHISDLMYQKRLLLTDYMNDKKTVEEINNKIIESNKKIDSILHEYEKTYLVAEENQSLYSFKEKLNTYNKLENHLLINKGKNIAHFESNLIPVFEEIRMELITLSQIQTSVGQDLMAGSHEMKNNASFIHYCQLGIILILMLIVQSIIFSAKSVTPKKPQKFNLN